MTIHTTITVLYDFEVLTVPSSFSGKAIHVKVDKLWPSFLPNLWVTIFSKHALIVVCTDRLCIILWKLGCSSALNLLHVGVPLSRTVNDSPLQYARSTGRHFWKLIPPVLETALLSQRGSSTRFIKGVNFYQVIHLKHFETPSRVRICGGSV